MTHIIRFSNNAWFLPRILVHYCFHRRSLDSFYWTFFAVAELRSTEKARCTITIRFVYEYATFYLLHAIPYLRMPRRVYDPKCVSPINYTIFQRLLDEKSSVTTYLGKIIIHIVLLQPPNTMYPPGFEVSDDIVSLCSNGPSWKSPDAELLQHTSFQKIIWEGKLFYQVILLDISMFYYLNQVNW